MSAAVKQVMSANLLAETIEKTRPVEDAALRARVAQRLETLAIPRGSLGRLEPVIFQYALATGQVEGPLPKKSLFVFCADHGFAGAGEPSGATYREVRAVAAGGAAVNVLCRQYDIDPVIVDMGVQQPFEPTLAVIDRKFAPGSKNFLLEPAMSRDDAVRSIETGIRLAQAAHELGYRLPGIAAIADGGRVSANAVIAALTNSEPLNIAEAEIIQRALDLHRPSPSDPLAVLAAVGGFEIGGMSGFLLGSAALRMPVCIDDGPATNAAALLAATLAPHLNDYLFRGGAAGLDRPLLDLAMESDGGASVAITLGLLESALRLYREITPLP